MSAELVVTLPQLFPWQGQARELFRAETTKRLCMVMGRRAGKTTLLAEVAGDVALDGGLVFWGAPTHDIASIGFDLVRRTYQSVIARSRQMPAEVEFVTGGRILFRSFDRPGAALGRGYDLAVIDEAARVKERTVYEDLVPTTADTGGKIVAISTPRGRIGWFFDWYNRGRAGQDGYAILHGPSTQNPSPEIRAFCDEAAQNMPDSLYRQEILAEFLEGEGAVFRRIAECATLDDYLVGPVPGASYAIGCDVAKHQDYTVLYAIETQTGAVHGMDRFNALDWTMIEARISGFAARWGGTLWLDSTGVGDAIYDRLAASGMQVQPYTFSSESKQNLVVALMTAMERGEISYPADPVLIGELESFAYEQLPSGKFRYSAPEGMHDDCVMALALAVWGRAQHAPLVMGWV